MSRSLNTVRHLALAAICLAFLGAGCNTEQPAAPGGAMQSGKMETGGAMESGKMETGGAMESGKMETGKMDPEKKM